jgi:hypothetical protein
VRPRPGLDSMRHRPLEASTRDGLHRSAQRGDNVVLDRLGIDDGDHDAVGPTIEDSFLSLLGDRFRVTTQHSAENVGQAAAGLEHRVARSFGLGGGFADNDQCHRGDGDRRTISAQRIAVRIERIQFAADLVEATRKIQLIRLGRDETEGAPLTVSADHDRCSVGPGAGLADRLLRPIPLSGEGGLLPAQHRPDDLQCLLESVELA